jgi:hypothetical protein
VGSLRDKAEKTASGASGAADVVVMKLQTIDEVAKRLRKSRRWLHDFLATLDNSRGQFWKQAGSKKLFSEAQFVALYEALPNELDLRRSRYAGPSRASRKFIPSSEASTVEDKWNELQKRLQKPSRGRSGASVEKNRTR